MADQNAAGCSSYSLEYLPPWLFPETFCAESSANSRRAARFGRRSNQRGTRQLILNLLKARQSMDSQAASWLRNPGNSLMPLKAALLFALTPAWASCLVELA